MAVSSRIGLPNEINKQMKLEWTNSKHLQTTKIKFTHILIILKINKHASH